MPDDTPTLPALLLALRERANLSQAAAAVYAGCGAERWRAVERGTSSPEVEEVARLLDACSATQAERDAIAAAAIPARVSQ